jgi:hypothetical protein
MPRVLNNIKSFTILRNIVDIYKETLAIGYFYTSKIYIFWGKKLSAMTITPSVKSS